MSTASTKVNAVFDDCVAQEACEVDSAACAVHVERNPLETVVSGYQYHRLGYAHSIRERASDRVWLDAPMWSVESAIASASRRRFIQWATQHLRAVEAVRRRAQSGPLAGVLPLPESLNESFSSYLRRVGGDEGLLAEAVAASVRTLPDMSQLHRAVQRRSGVNVCLSTLDSPANDCRTALARALRPFVRASKDAATLATLASRYACRRRGAEPRRPPAAQQSQRRLRENRRQMARLAEIDRKLLNGSLAAQASLIGCRSGPAYS